MDTNPEDISTWLARETGHGDVSDEGYGEEKAEEGPRPIGLPKDNHEKMRRFFDGLNVEKSLTEKRRSEALTDLDEAEAMNEALKRSIQPPQQAPQGGAY